MSDSPADRLTKHPRVARNKLGYPVVNKRSPLLAHRRPTEQRGREQERRNGQDQNRAEPLLAFDDHEYEIDSHDGNDEHRYAAMYVCGRILIR